MSAGIRFIEGFEGDEDSLVWESMTLTRSEDHARSGTFGVGHNTLGTNAGASPLFTLADAIIVGFAFRWQSPDFTDEVAILNILGPLGRVHIQLSIDAQRILTVRAPNEAGDLTARATSTPRYLDEGTWYYIEIGVEMHATSGSVHVQLNGPAGVVGSTSATVIGATGIRTILPSSEGNPALEGYNQFVAGVLGGFPSVTKNFSFDDFYVRSYDDGFLGDQAVIALALEDDRDVDFTRSSGVKNFDMLDEVAPDEDATYNESDTDAAQDVLEIADTTFTGTIHCVQLVARARKTQTQVWTLQTLLELDAVQSLGTQYYLGFPDYETLPPDVYGVAPGDLEWTAARVNALGVGYQIETP